MPQIFLKITPSFLKKRNRKMNLNKKYTFKQIFEQGGDINYNPTEEEILNLIFDNVFIRGIDLSSYKGNFSNEESGLYTKLIALF